MSTKRFSAAALAVALSFGFALLAWSAGHAEADAGAPKDGRNLTITELTCAPASVETGQSVHCVAVVSRSTSSSGGKIAFGTDGDGAFSAGSCNLVFGVLGKLGYCGVDYVHTAADGPTVDGLRATYLGDEANAPSQGDFELSVLPTDQGGGGGGGGESPEKTTTATTFTCSPDSVEAGQSVHCVATVNGLAPGTNGEVTFEPNGGGAFSSPSCRFSSIDKGVPASCGVDYIPAAGGDAVRQLRAAYLGDEANAPSQGDFELTVLPSRGGESPEKTTTATTFTCSPDSVEAGQSVHCVATVTGVTGATSGEVVFGSDDGGAFSVGSCVLAFSDKRHPPSCAVDYVPGADSSVWRRLHAAYLGDATNAPSVGDFLLAVPHSGGEAEKPAAGSPPPGGATKPSVQQVKHGVCGPRCRRARRSARISKRA